MRTPLSPRVTFTDDPLRVLRCIRFASRFGFAMVSELQDAARDAAIQVSAVLLSLHFQIDQNGPQRALRVKISRERVGEELDKMMGGGLEILSLSMGITNRFFPGRNPLLSIDMINNLSLYSTVFCMPENMGIALLGHPFIPRKALHAAMILHALTNPTSETTTLPGATSPSLPPVHFLLLSEVSTSAHTLRRLYLAAALIPYHRLTYIQAKGKVRPAAEAVIREGLKLGAQHHYLDGIPILFAGADLLKKGVSDWEGGVFDKPERAWIGELLSSGMDGRSDIDFIDARDPRCPRPSPCMQACCCATKTCTIP